MNGVSAASASTTGNTAGPRGVANTLRKHISFTHTTSPPPPDDATQPGDATAAVGAVMTPGDLYTKFAGKGAERGDAKPRVHFDETTTKLGAPTPTPTTPTPTSTPSSHPGQEPTIPAQAAFTGVVKERKFTKPPTHAQIQQGINNSEIQHGIAKLSIKMASSSGR